MREKDSGYHIAGSLENTDRIMDNTFWIGVFPGMTGDMLMKMAEEIKACL